jgi:dimethylhistidine N-methyltransferase
MSEMHLLRDTPAPLRGTYARHAHSSFSEAALAGLSATPKKIPCKFFYDARGSVLFDRICDLPEYYQTRTETALLTAHAAEIADCFGPGVELIEFGAGSLRKVRILLDALKDPLAYIPIDISGEYLAKTCAILDREYPGLGLHPLTADFTRPFVLPATMAEPACRVGFFPGSTIGNFTHEEAVAFLKTAAGILKSGGLLIGADLMKDPAILHAAYNDAEGVTASFNKNLLVRANRELDADFDIDGFAHYACYNPRRMCVEMYLVSLTAQRVSVLDEEFHFEAGEAIHTEDSHKYTIAGFHALARSAGFEPSKVWCDPDGLFSLHWLETK